MNKKKIIIASLVLLLVFAVGGAIAYFTDTDTKTNTFTIGNVDISLTEANWSTTDANNNNVPDAAENVVPGQSIPKDPVIKNESTTNPAYVFAKVVVPCTTATSPATPVEIFSYTPVNSAWTELSSAAVACTSGGTATHVYYYGTNNTLSSLAANTAAPALFTSITVSSQVTGANSEGLTGNKNVVVTGYGIQTQGLASTTPVDVWGNFNS